MRQLKTYTLLTQPSDLGYLIAVSMPKGTELFHLHAESTSTGPQIQIDGIIDPEETELEERYFKFIAVGTDYPFCADMMQCVGWIALVMDSGTFRYHVFEVKNFGVDATEWKQRFGTGEESARKYTEFCLALEQKKANKIADQLIAEQQNTEESPPNSWQGVDTKLSDDDFNNLLKSDGV